MPVSVHFSLYLEVVTTLDATFMVLALVERAARDRVVVPWVTYSGSCSSSEPITSRADGATIFEGSCV